MIENDSEEIKRLLRNLEVDISTIKVTVQSIDKDSLVKGIRDAPWNTVTNIFNMVTWITVIGLVDVASQHQKSTLLHIFYEFLLILWSGGVAELVSKPLDFYFDFASKARTWRYWSTYIVLTIIFMLPARIIAGQIAQFFSFTLPH